MKLHLCFVFAVLFAMSMAVSATEYRIEPESFRNIRHWYKSLDANTSGTCQLTAKEKKDNDIREQFLLPKPGNYFLWIRSFSFGDNNRKFKLRLNDGEVGCFGDAAIPAGREKPVLIWERYSQALTLPAGPFSVQISPVSPYARVDALILSDNPDFIPPETRAACNAIPELSVAPAEENAAIASSQIPATEFRIEPENFLDKKAWTESLDANTSGRCQLAARNKDNNALNQDFALPAGGTYFVWVRCFSYGDKARRIQLSLNDQILGIFGDAAIPEGKKKPTLLWERHSQPLSLSAGKLSLQITPLSPYARVDAILLTPDEKFVPPETRTACNAIPELSPASAEKKTPLKSPIF